MREVSVLSISSFLIVSLVSRLLLRKCLQLTVVDGAYSRYRDCTKKSFPEILFGESLKPERITVRSDILQ
jgi:hypothetical protein